ncbi:class I SAM-dependent RNA methyltransferase [Histidinibacterium aquaticum]|uniref:Class I SAM-dependent RNA methyltransferase n=1 Tax=Histidinibacterium aquaticum TaxID=2613962 RepID=A0A5J5GI07_9RHOB|nr:class I SAM-dependent RNA methyltransferase [Histidinibacterium aquaticum]
MEGLAPSGLGRAEDGSLVPFALPGDAVTAGGKVIERAAEHAAPPCPHFARCGGCVIQHASDAFVADWKAGMVRDALTRNGLSAEIAGVETSPPATRRRAKIAGRRTKSGALVGFHERRTHQIVPIPSCKVLRPALVELLPALETLTRRIASRKGEVAYTVTETETGPDLLISGGKALDGALRMELAAFAQEQSLSRLVWEDEPIVTRTPPFHRMGRAEVAPPPGAFLQATREGEQALVSRVTEAVGDARRVIDLFSGCGTFSLPLAERAEVHAVEVFGPMLKSLDHGWRHAKGLKRVTTETRDLFREPVRADELSRFEAAVLDPPRKGARAQVAQVAASSLGRVVMVSCNPATFAQDARVLVEAGFEMGPITVVDQFRWSAHVELVSAFTRL